MAVPLQTTSTLMCAGSTRGNELEMISPHQQPLIPLHCFTTLDNWDHQRGGWTRGNT